SVTLTGTTSVGTTTSLTSTGASGNITATDGDNDFGGVVTVNTAHLTATGNANLVDSNSLTLGTTNVGGDLGATATDALEMGATNVGGELAASGTSVTLTGTTSVGTTTSLTSTGGDITDTGDGNLQATETTDLNAAGNITLDNSANNFGGEVTTTATGNANLVDSDDLTLGTTNVDGNLNATATDALEMGTTDVGGSLTATGNDVTVTGIMETDGGKINIHAENNFLLSGGTIRRDGGGYITKLDHTIIEPDPTYPLEMLSGIVDLGVVNLGFKVETTMTNVNFGGKVNWSNGEVFHLPATGPNQNIYNFSESTRFTSSQSYLAQTVTITVYADFQNKIIISEGNPQNALTQTTLELDIDPADSNAPVTMEVIRPQLRKMLYVTTFVENGFEPKPTLIASLADFDENDQSGLPPNILESRSYYLRRVVNGKEISNDISITAEQFNSTDDLYAELPDDRYRLYVKLEDGSEQLILEIDVRDGIAVEVDDDEVKQSPDSIPNNDDKLMRADESIPSPENDNLDPKKPVAATNPADILSIDEFSSEKISKRMDPVLKTAPPRPVLVGKLVVHVNEEINP
ncbi:MAG: hypothetical protein P8M80_04455, partial [Pirellulaceae bacterium]|nr:hypothetical protein [Pirellulaceae bacterium]